MYTIVLVIDSFGIGAMPDAEAYGDAGANTAGHICSEIAGEKWPVLRSLGLGNASPEQLTGCDAVEAPKASYGIMAERSPGKDTTTGHWELMGHHLEQAFYTFPKGPPSFPDELITELTEEIGRGVLGNKAASGTEIIQELGAEHLETGKPIVYTSSDSVFQIAAHESIIPVDELYEICTVARRLCDRYHVARVIARPFTGEKPFTRTERRRDFSMPPPGPTLLDELSVAGIETIGVGKIGDIFVERGLTASYHDKGNPACLGRTLSLLGESSRSEALVFVNLVDTDMIYGHRRDVQGYFDAVTAVDVKIGEMIPILNDDDALIVTADHGCDPTYRGTDHTREYVPVLWYERRRESRSLGTRTTFADLAVTVAKRHGIEVNFDGAPFFA